MSDITVIVFNNDGLVIMIAVFLLISITFITFVLFSGDHLLIGVVFFLTSLSFLAYFGYIPVPDILVWKDN